MAVPVMQASLQQEHAEKLRIRLEKEAKEPKSTAPRNESVLDFISKSQADLAAAASLYNARQIEDILNLIRVCALLYCRGACRHKLPSAVQPACWASICAVVALLMRKRFLALTMQVLDKATKLTDQESQPVNDEAQRVLKFFVSTLFNSKMPCPSELEHMRSLTTLVPHYAEDVIYPIDADEIQYRTGKPVTPGKVTELVGIMEGMEISTLQFLKIQFCDEWDNFVERLADDPVAGPRLAKVDKSYVNVGDFQRSNADGLFHDDDFTRMALMKWASERGQLLWRTTKGMMLYAQALRTIKVLEAEDAVNQQHEDAFIDTKFRCDTTPVCVRHADQGQVCRDPTGVCQQHSQAATEPAVSTTQAVCRHIVAAQVYGEKAADSKGENKWIASSIDVLMKEYPSFRVAYMDKVKDHPLARDHGVTHSVLLRWDEDKNGPVEMYRVRLPWQTETKTGVVCHFVHENDADLAIIVASGATRTGCSQGCGAGAWRRQAREPEPRDDLLLW